jgi:hypothetical protein
VEWDAAGRVARVGHNPQIFAEHTSLRFDVTLRTLAETGGTGRLTFSPVKWTTWPEYREELRAARESESG